MRRYDKDKVVHLLFVIGLLAKAVDSVLEIAGGIILAFVNPAQIRGIVRLLTQHELSEDPHDLVANFLLHSAQHLSTSTKTFATVFLLWHGAVKAALVFGLLREKLWVFPTAIAAFCMFLAYQFYRYSHTHSAWLLVLSFLDIFVIVLTWLEYRRLGRFRKPHQR